MSKRVTVYVVAALLIGALLWWMRRPTPSGGDPVIRPLAANEAARIRVTEGEIATLTHAAPVAQRRYVPPEGSVTVTVGNDGDVSEEVVDHGFTFELGPGLAYSERPVLLLDCELWYWNRLGANAGVALSNRGVIARPYLALSYQLDQLHLDNTSILVGVTVRREPIVGLRIAF